jgi:hypothetical protein
MEELQLALTATRVDQKNFGLWLKSWQVGRVLQALVTDKAPSGQLVLRIDGHQISATTDIPVQKGAVLRLEVSSLTPTPTLKILGEAPATAARTNPLSGQLQILLPRQGQVASPFAFLLDPAVSANILALLGLKSDALEPLLRHLARLEQLADPRLLREAINRSGLFHEPRLLNMDLAAKPGPDMKADLLGLLRLVEQALQQPRSGANQALLAFRDRLEGAISTITLNQLAARPADDRGNCSWLIHLPLQLGEGVHDLSLAISRDGSGSADGQDKRPQEWRAQLSLDLPLLGPIEAELYLRAGKVAAVIYSQQADTARLMEAQLGQLRKGLESRGLEVSVLLSHQGARSAEQPSPKLDTCLDERV